MSIDTVKAYSKAAWGWISGTVGGWPTYNDDEIEHLADAAWEVAQPGHVLAEIGSFSGKSLSVLLGVARERGSKVVAADLFGWDPQFCRPHLRRVLADFADVDNVFYPCPSEVAAKCASGPPGEIYLKPGEVDLVHIDGYHSYDAVKLDFECWAEPYLRSGGIVAFHDANPDPRAPIGNDVLRAAMECTPGWETTWHSLAGNCLLIRRKP